MQLMNDRYKRGRKSLIDLNRKIKLKTITSTKQPNSLLTLNNRPATKYICMIFFLIINKDKRNPQ